jgi:formate hydrogenlyase subunit 7
MNQPNDHPGLTIQTDGNLGRVGEQLRSLHVRHVDAGSCNACESEIKQLTSPYYDVHRLGIFFVTSPRHADLLLVTGPVTRSMEAPLLRTYEAMPDPRLVVGVGACACDGGIFGQSCLTRGGLSRVLPVDVLIAGCPPTPFALIHGLLLAIGRAEQRLYRGEMQPSRGSEPLSQPPSHALPGAVGVER